MTEPLEPDVVEDDFDPFADLENREHLEAVAAARQQQATLDTSAWAGDPVAYREVIQRSKAEKAKEKILAPIPTPEIPSRQATPDELLSCQSAHRLVRKGLDAVYSVRTRFARGPWISGRRSLGTRDVLTVMLDSDTDRVRAIWLRSDEGAKAGKWSFHAGWHYSPYRHEEGSTWKPISSPAITKLLASE